MSKNSLNFIDMFSGIGGFRTGLERAGHKCIGFSEIDKYAIQSYKAIYDTEDEIELGDISKISDKELSLLEDKVDIVVGGSPCFRKGTMITTIDGLKPIEDIKVGDLVLTHKDRFKEVVLPMVNHTTNIFKLRCMNSQTTYVTGEHPIRVVERLENGKYSDEKWVKVKDLVKGKHYVRLGNAENVDSFSKNPMGITKEEAYLIGRYIADGYLLDYKRKDRINSHLEAVVFCIGKDKKLDFEKELSHYKVKGHREKNIFRYKKTNPRLFELCSLCGKGSENKEIPIEFLLLPDYLKLEILRGYTAGDGSFDGETYSFTTVSEKLALSLTNLINSLYHSGCSIIYTKRPDKTTIEGRVVNQRSTYRVQFKPKVKSKRHTVFLKNNLFTPIRLLEKLSTDENVYNFEVKDDNSYVANNMVVHNCQSFSNAGRRLGFEDTRGTLFFEYARMIKDTQPKYFIYENVKGMLSHDNNRTFEIVLNTFNELGYYIDFNIFNSKFYGVPQDRERVYIVGVRKDLLDNVEEHERKPKTLLINRANNWAIENVDSYVKILPELKDTQNTTISDILEDIFSKKQLVREDFLDKVRLNDDLSGKVNHWAYRSRDDIRSLFGVSPTLLTMQGGNDEPKIAFPVEGYHKPFGRHNHNEGINFIITDKNTNDVIEKNVLKMVEIHEPTKYLTDDKYELKLTLEPELIGTLTENQNGTLYLKDNVIYKHNKLDENELEGIQHSSKMDNPTLMFPNLNFALILNDDKSKCYIVKDLDTHYDIIRVIDKEDIEFIGSDTFEIVPRVAIRKLSPLECWRLQGFSDEQYFKAKATGITKSQLLKQAGNSVTTNIVEYIAKHVIK